MVNNKKEVSENNSNYDIIKQMKSMEKIFQKNICILEGIEENKDKEYKQEILKEMVYSTEYFLYKIKANIDNPI